MEENVEMEELPYIVWYQCRMCTHLFFDDVEKMLSHLDMKHGAMIDCDELRSIVFKNGLAMGGLSRPLGGGGLNVKVEKDSVTYTQIEDGEVDMLKKVQEGAELIKNDVDGKKDNFGQNGDYNDGVYEEGEEYHSTNEEEGIYYEDNNSINDDEEQLAEGNLDLNDDAGQYEEEYNDETDSQQGTEILSKSSLYGEYGEVTYNEEGEEGEISPEQSFNDDDLEEQTYENELENGGDGQDAEIYSSDSNQNGGLLNYGYSCKFCGKFFTTRRGVESHEQHHTSQNSLLVRRPNEPKLYPCKICKSKAFQSFKDLKSHVKSHTTDRIHICKFCFITFNNTASLTKHLTIHNRENPNKCWCGKTFVSANTLKIHKKIHTGIKPFVCNFFQCGRAFVTKSTLESHLRTHTGEKPYACSYCQSSFTTSSAKYRHERHVHKVPEPNAV